MISAKTDGALLAEYVASGRGEPFEEVLRRHNALVYGVCLRTLGNREDAEDAAQAAFVMLAQNARSLQTRASVAGWLYQVAWNISRNARRLAAIRRKREREVGRMEESASDKEWEQVKSALDHELASLPEKYRVPIILHYVEGRTEEECAREMGCKSGALAMRLSRAREMLRGRLARAGVAVSTGLLFALIAQKAATATASSAAIASAVKAAGLIAAGQGVALSVVSPQVGILVKGGVQAMMLAKIKAVTAAVAVFAAVGVGGAAAVHSLTTHGQQEGLTPQSFAQIHQLIRPHDNEWRHLKVQWITDVVAARKKAVAEDKPMAVCYTGGAGYNEPLGVC